MMVHRESAQSRRAFGARSLSTSTARNNMPQCALSDITKPGMVLTGSSGNTDKFAPAPLCDAKSNAAHDLVDTLDAALLFLLVDKSHAEYWLTLAVDALVAVLLLLIETAHPMYWLTPAVDALDAVCLLLRAVSVTVDRVGVIVSLSSLPRESASTTSAIALTWVLKPGIPQERRSTRARIRLLPSSLKHSQLPQSKFVQMLHTRVRSSSFAPSMMITGTSADWSSMCMQTYTNSSTQHQRRDVNVGPLMMRRRLQPARKIGRHWRSA